MKYSFAVAALLGLLSVDNVLAQQDNYQEDALVADENDDDFGFDDLAYDEHDDQQIMTLNADAQET